jgi:glycosyltransferase involved in cell wall biosynthesis
MSKKLFVVSEMYLNTGFGNLATQVVKRLAQRGANISAMAPNAWLESDLKGAAADGIMAVPACAPGANDPYGTQTLPDLLKASPPDAIWFNNDIMPVWKWWQITKAALATNLPRAVAYIAVDGPVMRPRLFKDLLDDGMHVVTYTQYGVDAVLEGIRSIGGDVERAKTLLSFIPLAVNRDVFKPPESRIQVRRQLNALFQSDALKDDDFVINITNRNAPRKMIGLSILAAGDVALRHRNVKVLVRSGWRDVAGDFRQFIAYTKAPGDQFILAWPSLAGGNGVPDGTLAALYQASDVFLSCSVGEGHGLCEHEAAACGCALVLPRNTVRPELWGGVARLVPCKGMFIVPAHCQTIGETVDLPDVISALDDYRGNKVLLDSERALCVERARQLPTWDAIADHMEARLWPKTP